MERDLEILKLSLEGIKSYIQNSVDTNKFKVKNEDLRTLIEYNERLSHCGEESFLVRSFLEGGISRFISEIEDTIEQIDYLIDEIQVFHGDNNV